LQLEKSINYNKIFNKIKTKYIEIEGLLKNELSGTYYYIETNEQLESFENNFNIKRGNINIFGKLEIGSWLIYKESFDLFNNEFIFSLDYINSSIQKFNEKIKKVRGIC